jgi:hypothetical protein
MPRTPVWLAGISICLLAGFGIVEIVRSIPASHASNPVERMTSFQASTASGDEDARTMDLGQRLPVASVANNRRNRLRCPECGVIQSMREVERPRPGVGQDIGDIEDAGNLLRSASSAGATIPAFERRYEFTVRLGDGTTTVFTESSPRSWRVGSRVIVIAGSNPSGN